MKKRSLVIIFLILTLVFACMTTSVCFAEDGESSDEFTKTDTIKLIVCYCVCGLSIVVGIPAIRAVNKRKKVGYVSDLCVDTEKIAEQVKTFYNNRDKERSKREIIKYSLKIASVADMALTTYTEKQISGYYDMYNDLTKLKNSLSDIQNHNKDADYDAQFAEIVKLSENIVNRAKILKNNEDIVERYNK